MRRMAILLLIGASACGYTSEDSRGPEPDVAAPDPDPDPTPAPLTCDLCVDTPPATFTGPSNFWMGLLAGATSCPAATPLQGLEGFLVHPSRARQFARECRITPSDTCATEGKVCAPAPDADYHTCIHHTGDMPCPAAYPERYPLTETESDLLLTLCCQPSPIPG